MGAAVGAVLAILARAGDAAAQTAQVAGAISDETGARLPGVVVELTTADGAGRRTDSDACRRIPLRCRAARAGPAGVPAGELRRGPARDRRAALGRRYRSDAVLSLSLTADVTVTGKSTFTNLADVERPAENLVGIAQSASQGAITARQLDARPVMRTAEVLETVPGMVISQHSGEGKANQYYLRGFNLDHGTDFATTVAGMPVNMPTHGHGHGYADLNFLIPELVSGVQFSKGPYFAEHGDFATAGAGNINYTNSLARPIVRGGGWRAGVHAGAGGGVDDGSRRHSCSAPSSCSTTTAPGSGPTTSAR